jgi:MarR family transcriptional regulator, organic hydroperoxide resistance regulator
MVRVCRILRVTRTNSPARPELVDLIVGQFRASLGELRCIASERLVRQGVSMGHLHVMSMLERHGDLPMNRIAEILDVSDSNATGLIDRMEERGLVERVRAADDRRVVLVRVTDKGRAVLDDVEVVRDDMLRGVLAELDDAKLARLAEAFGDIREAIADILAKDPAAFTHAHQKTSQPVTERRSPVGAS